MPAKEKVDYRKVIVKKPWGYEYLMYDNPNVGLWYLRINQGQRTSMHCHPQKKTGLVLLSGEGILSFLSGSNSLKPVSKVMIREGLFHSTQAISPGGATIIEVETPRDKGNLVRMDDEYGRQTKPYESGENLLPNTPDALRLKNPKSGEPRTFMLDGCRLTIEKIDKVEALLNRPKDSVIVVLIGGLKSRDGQPILGPGDVVAPEILNRLAEKFPCPKGATILMVERTAKP